MEQTDYFSIDELYFLLAAVDMDVIMGLPDKEDDRVTVEQKWENAKKDLEAKGLVNESGELTRAGMIIVEVLKEYNTGIALTIVNNVYVMKSQADSVSIVLIDTSKGYILFKTTSMHLLKLFQERIPIMLREPQAQEREFLTRPAQMTPEYEALFVSDESVFVQYYPLFEMMTSSEAEELYQQHLFSATNTQLLSYNIRTDTVSIYSQYYFLERMYTWLGIPFREEDFALC